MPDAFQSQKRLSDPLGIVLQIVVSLHVDVGNQASSLGKQPALLITELNHLSSPSDKILIFKGFCFSHEQDLILISLV